MAGKRRVNWISQQRVDVPDMRAVESAVSNDYDELIQSYVTGTGNGYVVRGFALSMSGAIGGAASGLQVLVDPGALLHVNSAQSGTFYLVPAGTQPEQLNSATNTIVDGAFAPNAINYVSLEYERYIDDATSSQVYLWNPTTNNETTKVAPRAQILRYRFKISTSVPASNFLPIAIVATDSGNNVIRIDDARQLINSQGKGGFNPDPFYKFTYPNSNEPNPNSSTSNSVNPFVGGDKDILTEKDKFDAITTEIQKIKGTPYWTSTNTSGSLASIRSDLGNTVITGRGMIAHSAVTPGLINWSDDINIRVIGTQLTYTLLANPTSTDITLAENEVAYITLVRGITITPSLVFTNGSMVVTSVGAVAWTGLLQSGDLIKLGSATDAGYYEINTVDSLTQVTLTEAYAGASTGPAGSKAKYAFGSYQTSPTPSSNRDIFIADRADVPLGEDVFWLMLRSDNGGSLARAYIRFLGQELEAGEEEDVSGIINKNIILYVGSPIESATKPAYVSALNAGSVAEVQDILVGDASSIASNKYFMINSSANARKYYFWFNKDGAGIDPNAPGRVGIEVDITSGMTDVQVANALAQAFATTFVPDFTAVQRTGLNANTVRVTNNSAGTCVAAANFNIGAPFAVTVITTGTGVGNYIVNDGDNLTLAIKKLDHAFGLLEEALDSSTYDEDMAIVAPVSPGTFITLPLNSRLANIQQEYTVGRGTLQLFLNGQYLDLGNDWDEVGSAGSASDQIIIQRALVIDDVLIFRLGVGGGGGAGGGGGEVGPQGPPGPAGPAGSDALGGPITVSTKIANYTLMLADKVTKVDCATNSADITITLPPAASAQGYVFYVKKIDATAFNMIVKGFSSELIDGLNMQSSNTQWEAFMLISDGVVWSLH